MMRERGNPSGSFEVPLVDQMNLKCFTTRSFNTLQSARVRYPTLFICRTYIWMAMGMRCMNCVLYLYSLIFSPVGSTDCADKC